MFDQTTSIGVGTILNRLPQFTPAVTQFTTADVQQTATNTVGLPAAPRLGHAAGSASFIGHVAEFIVCNAKLSGGDRTSMKAYIATKFGLTIA